MNCCATCNASQCYQYCAHCKGTGTVIGIAMGLGIGSLVPAYSEQVCKNCGGDGLIYCGYYNNGGNA